MTIEQAIKILSEHNRWRVGEIDAYMHKPSEITKAIDLVLEAVREKGDKPSCLGDDMHQLSPELKRNVWVRADKPVREYPLGTKFKALMGGHWIRVERGFKWCTGSTFPNVGGDWTGEVCLPNII